MQAYPRLARLLAAELLTGPLTQAELAARGAAFLERRPRWLAPLARRIVARFGAGARPRQYLLGRFIFWDPGFASDLIQYRRPHRRRLHVHPAMQPAAGPPAQWAVPAITTPGELARRLNLDLNELAWFADTRTLEAKVPDNCLRHYHYRWLVKRHGGARLIESPKQRLKALQRHILSTILDRIPPHPAAHGFRAGRSVRSFTAPHIGRVMVLRLDLQDFFPTIQRSRILGIFLTAGYPEAVAELLTGLCTNTAPAGVLTAHLRAAGVPAAAARARRQLYQRPHLPQGAPTSPALANLAAFRLDCRLAGYAKSSGVHYTRYADDLVFSGGEEFRRGVERFYVAVCAIALEEGFPVQTRKTRVMGRSVSQRAAGVVLNEKPNLPRTERDALKALLHNCLRHGPASQNRDGHPDFQAHLAGRLAHLATLNPLQAARLRRDFERIVW